MALANYLPRISGRQAAKYVLLPGIMPRVRELAGSGFGYLAFLIASVYQAVRILPAGHPYTLPGNIGTFGLRAVVREAANHVHLDRKHIDQVIVYFAVLIAIALLFLQFAGVVFLFFSGQAFAQGLGSPDDYGFFTTNQPEKDIAFQLLDYVFGVPDFFGSDVPTGTPFHVALQFLFKFYNVAILIVAALIFLYYVVVVVAETAQSGTPFGNRFNSIYAPFRLVVALGLLVPLNYGLNGAQYITLYAAKIGSGFATNGWLNFNKDLENPLGAEKKTLIAEPIVPSLQNLVEFIAVVHACRAGYELKDTAIKNTGIRGYVISDGTSYDWDGMSFGEASRLNEGGVIQITFGHHDATRYPTEDGNVFPFCGKLNIPVTVPYDPNSTRALSAISEVNWNRSQSLWHDGDLAVMANKMAQALNTGSGNTDTAYKPDDAEKQAIISRHNQYHQTDIKQVFEKARQSEDFSLPEDIKKRGWGGAGIWYNKLAEINGAYFGAVYDIPSSAAYPTVLQFIHEQKRGSDAGSNKCTVFEPNLADGKPIRFNEGNDAIYARIMYHMQKSWSCDTETSTKNVFWDAMHMIFGVKGLFDMRCNNESNVHPLVQLTSIGKGLIDSSVRNMAMAMFTAAGGGMSAVIGEFGGDLSAMGKAASSFFVTMATIGLSIGFLLFYILPFMPFLYFFFAVGAWLKGIFEAMVGVPLWALAHLKIDGEGLPGKAAIGGYYLIFEIFLRPILIVAGLIGGMVIFSASVAILNEIFDVAVLRLTGVNINSSNVCSGNPGMSAADAASASDIEGRLDKHIIDEFFFTIMYAIFVYMIAMSCFKMIDLIPNNILRFMGGTTTPFADEVQDPTENLGQYAAISGATIGGKVVGGLAQASQAGGSAVAGIADMAQKMGKPPPTQG